MLTRQVKRPGGIDRQPLSQRLTLGLHRALEWLSPGGALKRWLKYCLTLAIMFGIPILLFVPLVTLLLGALAEWMLFLQKICEALLKVVACLALVLLLLALIYGGLKAHRDKRRE